MNEKSEVEKLAGRHDNLPLTTRVLKLLGNEGYNAIEEVMAEWIAQDPQVKEALEANPDNIMRTMAAPIESALYGITTVELRKKIGDEQSLLGAHPPETFGELKARLTHLPADIAEAVGTVQDMSHSEVDLLESMYGQISRRMQTLTDALQQDLVAGRQR